jgi:CO dehydrogenase maturation factor
MSGPDGVRLVLMGMPGHAEEGCLCSSHATVSALVADLGTRPDTVTVLDMEASPEHLGRGTTRHADALLLVTEPYYRSLETVRRMAVLAAEMPIARVAVVANKVRSADAARAIEEFCERHQLELIGSVPWNDEVIEADLAGIPLLDAAPDAPAVLEISRIAERLHESPNGKSSNGRAPGGA